MKKLNKKFEPHKMGEKKCICIKSSQVSSNINHYEKLWFEQNIRASAQHFLPPSILQSSVTSALLRSINYRLFQQQQFLFSPSVSPDINNVSGNPCNRALLSNLAEFREIENITVQLKLIFAQLQTPAEEKYFFIFKSLHLHFMTAS